MALDTVQKRSMAISPILPWRNFLPLPESGVSTEDRAQVLGLFIVQIDLTGYLRLRGSFGQAIIESTFGQVLRAAFGQAELYASFVHRSRK